MPILLLTFFYTFPASLVFIYGIGYEQLFVNNQSSKQLLYYILKNTLFMLLLLSFIRLIIYPVFSSAKIFFLFPLLSGVALYLSEYVIYQIIFKRKVTKMPEQTFNYGIILFSVYHTFTYFGAVLVLLCSIFGVCLWSIVIRSIQVRIASDSISKTCNTAIPLILVSMGIIALSLYAWDHAWITVLVFWE